MLKGIDAGYMVDSKGTITFITDSLAQLVDSSSKAAVGCDVQKILPHTEVQRVLATGQPERHQFVAGYEGEQYVVSRIPMINDGKVVGAFGFLERVIWPQVARHSFYDALPCRSLAAREAKNRLFAVARYDTPVLLTGETGCGKEFFARALHELSVRSRGPFVSVNCAAINETLAESELFGYVNGAFTGAAKKGHKGKFEQANGGTLFLDEIGELPLSMQAKLLRVLQEKVVDPVGGDSPRKVDVRIVAATHRDLEAMVATGEFRLDLYFRLNVVPIAVPPLRHQLSDINELAGNIWHQLCGQYHKFAILSPNALAFLSEQRWPGNIRELRNTLERALIFCEPFKELGDKDLMNVMTPAHLQACASLVPTHHGPAPADEKSRLTDLLNQCAGNRSQVARALGISRALLYKKLHKYHLM